MIKYIHIVCSKPDALFPYSLRNLLEDTLRFEKVLLGSFDQTQGFIEGTSSAEKTLWILFHDHADEKNMALAKVIRSRHNNGSLLLLLLDKMNPDMIRSFIQLGKVGIVNANISISELLTYIGEVPEKNFILDNSLQETLLQSFLQPDLGSICFSKREREILALAEKGYNIHKTAETLNLSGNTVASYRSRILKRAKAGSMIELLAGLRNRDDIVI